MSQETIGGMESCLKERGKLSGVVPDADLAGRAGVALSNARERGRALDTDGVKGRVPAPGNVKHEE